MIRVASIVTSDYVESALTMFQSMRQFIPDCTLDLLVVSHHKQYPSCNIPHVQIHCIEDFCDHPELGQLFRLALNNYSQSDCELPAHIGPLDYLRWSVKPLFSNILLEKYHKIFFCDHDLYFYSDFSFLDELSEGKSICLSPHWRTIYHSYGREWQYNYRHGVFNGGFFIVSRAGKKIMDWWAEMCLFRCSASCEYTYVDQKYLDLVPLYFDDVEVIKHKGCNVADWNRTYLERKQTPDGVMVGGQPIVFIHYSRVTVESIRGGDDHLLHDHLVEYEKQLEKTRMFLIHAGLPKFTTLPITTQII